MNTQATNAKNLIFNKYIKFIKFAGRENIVRIERKKPESFVAQSQYRNRRSTTKNNFKKSIKICWTC